MAILVSPTPNAQTYGNFKRTVALDGVNYQYQFIENSREDFWYLNILDTEDNPIRTGIKIVSNWPLIRLMRNTPRPPGEVITIDTRAIADDPSIDEFGIDVLLGYAEEASIP